MIDTIVRKTLTTEAEVDLANVWRVQDGIRSEPFKLGDIVQLRKPPTFGIRGRHESESA